MHDDVETLHRSILPRSLVSVLALGAAGAGLLLSASFDRAYAHPETSTALLFTAIALVAGMQGREVAVGALLAHAALTLSPASLNVETAARFLLALVSGLGVAHLASSRDVLRATAAHDPLTGLLNRRGLAHAVARRGSGDASAIAVFDLDRFKALNDRHGHAAGDRALMLLAEVLRESRRGDVAARLGGDEFALVMADGVEDANRAAGRLRATFVDRCRDAGFDLDVSVGVACVHDGALDEALLEADRAMYSDKARHHRPAPIERRLRKHVRVWPLAVAAGLALGLAPGAASAQHQRGGSSLHEVHPPVPSTDVRFELLGGSLAPISAELAGRLVFLDRIFLSLSLGVGTYGDAAYVLATELGASATGAQLAHDLASGLFSMRAEVGLRPLPGEGFEVAVGYAMIAREGRLRAGTVTDATGISTEGSFVAGAYMLHAIHAELGWTFRLLDRFLVRPAIGWLHVLDATASLDDLGTSYADQSLDALANTAVGYAETWGMTPTVSLSLGYSF